MKCLAAGCSARWTSAPEFRLASTPHRLVTVANDKSVFHKPVPICNCLLVYASTERIVRTSIAIQIEAMVEGMESLATETVTEGRFVFAAIDDARQPIPVTWCPGSRLPAQSPTVPL